LIGLGYILTMMNVCASETGRFVILGESESVTLRVGGLAGWGSGGLATPNPEHNQ